MFRHVVLLSFGPHSAPGAIDEVVTRLRALPGEVPTIRAYSVGRDAKLASGNADLAVVADFDDEDGYRLYATHPAHLAVITTAIAPILSSRVAVQYEMDAV